MSNKRVFAYKYRLNNTDYEFDYDLQLPTVIPLEEHCSTIISSQLLPVYLKQDLEAKLREFISNETQMLYDDVCEAALERLDLNDDALCDEISDYWSVLYKNTYKCELSQEITDLETRNDEIKLNKLYHNLIHSELMQVLLSKEREYMIEINDFTSKRDEMLKRLEVDHQHKIETALKVNNNNRQVMPDAYISQFVQQHVEQTELEKSKMNSKIDNLKLQQKNEFRAWLQRLDTDVDFRASVISNYMKQQEKLLMNMKNYNNLLNSDNKLQESYTIQLGAQLKSTHNLRLIKCDILDYARNRFNLRVDMIEPQTIQSAIQLYSNTSLCAMVMLVDCNLRKFNKISEQFANICDESTELHFQTYEQQLIGVENYGDKLNIGDFYITRHSNLSQVHTVFHLAYDDNLSKQRTDHISSRHPIILGLRNILKVCFKYNITTITLPLLLSHEMTEEMTINWVMKRAELVLKCLKGFMIEFVQWSSLESRTLQFVLPYGLMDETFHSISNLIKTIFRESRVVNLS